MSKRTGELLALDYARSNSPFAPMLDKGSVTPELVFLNGGLASIHPST